MNEKMSFLDRENYQNLLNELSTGDIEETRRVEIIDTLGKQHHAGLDEYENLQATYEETTGQLNQSRDAMAKMYNQLNAQNLGVNVEGTNEEPDTQESITLDELLSK